MATYYAIYIHLSIQSLYMYGYICNVKQALNPSTFKSYPDLWKAMCVLSTPAVGTNGSVYLAAASMLQVIAVSPQGRETHALP